MIRTCPDCKSTLHSFNNYFCSNCGKKLPVDLQLGSVPVKIRKIPLNTEEKSKEKVKTPFSFKRLDKRLFIGLYLILGSGLVYLGLKYALPFLTENVFQKSSLQELAVLPEKKDVKPVHKERTLTSNLLYSSGTFNQQLTSKVPSDIDLYLNALDINWLLDSSDYFDTEKKALFSEYLDENFTLMALRMEDLPVWVLVFNLKKELPAELIEESLPYDSWAYTLTDKRLTVTNYEDALDFLSQAERGVIKNLSQSSAYVTSTLNVPKEGQALILFLNHEGRKAFESLKSLNIADKHGALVDKVLDFGYNEIVLKGLTVE